MTEHVAWVYNKTTKCVLIKISYIKTQQGSRREAMDFTPARKRWEALPPEERFAVLKNFLESRIEKVKSFVAVYEKPKDSKEKYCRDYFSGELNAYLEVLNFCKLGQPGGQK